jgi:hypothetical protein
MGEVMTHATRHPLPEHRHGDPASPADDGTTHRSAPAEAAMRVRESDLEPYVGLGYLSKLFRFIAVFLAILLVAEIATGLVAQGRAAIPTLLAEASRLIVLAGLLWGAGDLAILFIDIGHDVRATRILIGRQVAHHVVAHHGEGGESLPAGERPAVDRPVPGALAADRTLADRAPGERTLAARPRPDRGPSAGL